MALKHDEIGLLEQSIADVEVSITVQLALIDDQLGHGRSCDQTSEYLQALQAQVAFLRLRRKLWLSDVRETVA